MRKGIERRRKGREEIEGERRMGDRSEEDCQGRVDREGEGREEERIVKEEEERR